MLHQAAQILEGTFNNVTNRKQELYNQRMKICNSCRLMIVDDFFGPMCNRKLWIDPNTDEVSLIPLPGFTNGCGCFLESKCRVPGAQCPIKKW